jgi:DNA-directed RNA polymerase subunit F
MTNPEFIEEKTMSLSEVKEALAQVEDRDKELGYLSNKTKEYLDAFSNTAKKVKEDLHKQLVGLKLTRLKEDHMAKIIDFLPKTVDELKVVLQAYPLSMPKKDQEAIVNVVKTVSKT